MKEYKNIFLLIEKELEERKKSTLEYYNLFCKVDDKNKKLEKEIEMLKKDLFELSREYFKK